MCESPRLVLSLAMHPDIYTEKKMVIHIFNERILMENVMPDHCAGMKK